MDLSGTMGVLFIGTFIASMILDAFHVVLIFHAMYYYMVLNFDDPAALQEAIWSFKVQDIFGAICVSSVQTLYAIRIWKLDAVVHKNSPFRRVLPVIVSFLLLAGYAGSLSICYEIVRPSTVAGIVAIQWMIYLPAAAWAAVDVSIAISMCYLLARSRTGFERTDSTIMLLMLFTLNTGVITSILSIFVIITRAAWPEKLVFVAFVYSLVKMHVNSFMAMLNARRFVRNYHNAPNYAQDGLSTPHATNAANSQLEFRAGRVPRTIDIHLGKVVKDETLSAGLSTDSDTRSLIGIKSTV
ncbi:uncharacterized protein FIBRA_03283 [Fibroporia radiculosa]|uniref:DUF6534 domain-containing protein n=1 Tax=Fibroporia radiculosa TaxID=599839 RepID=J4GNE2_9APHY|nr:uncharacterized protein FIBRA_03283 [Fibroporia radiculosa]CCM01235.1 predicted protein [Fibroporia radiculosa]